MADLGSFGTAKPEPEQVDTFGFFGATIRVNPAFGELDLADFFEVAASIDEKDNAQAMGALKAVFRACIHPEDFDTFWATAKRERQGIEDLMGVVMAVVEAVADRPTVRPSDSSAGPSSTSAISADASSSQVIAHLEEIGRPSVAKMVRDREAFLASA